VKLIYAFSILLFFSVTSFASTEYTVEQAYNIEIPAAEGIVVRYHIDYNDSHTEGVTCKAIDSNNNQFIQARCSKDSGSLAHIGSLPIWIVTTTDSVGKQHKSQNGTIHLTNWSNAPIRISCESVW
jgi:hypothetical protein